jgi:hypothetical protein
MKYLFIVLFVLGGMFSMAAYGTEGKQKRAYWIIAGAIWLLTFVLASTLL